MRRIVAIVGGAILFVTFVFVHTARAELTHKTLTASDLSIPVYQLQRWAGKNPWKEPRIWKDPDLAALLLKALGVRRFNTLMDWTKDGVASPAQLDGDILTFDICKAHECGANGADVKINLRTHFIEVKWREFVSNGPGDTAVKDYLSKKQGETDSAGTSSDQEEKVFSGIGPYGQSEVDITSDVYRHVNIIGVKNTGTLNDLNFVYSCIPHKKTQKGALQVAFYYVTPFSGKRVKVGVSPVCMELYPTEMYSGELHSTIRKIAGVICPDHWNWAIVYWNPRGHAQTKQEWRVAFMKKVARVERER